MLNRCQCRCQAQVGLRCGPARGGARVGWSGESCGHLRWAGRVRPVGGLTALKMMMMLRSHRIVGLIM